MTQHARIEGQLPLTANGGIQVELVPMPSGDNPWRTREHYENEQRRDTARFWLTIVALVVSILGTSATAVIAITEIRALRPVPAAVCEPTPLPREPPLPRE